MASFLQAPVTVEPRMDRLVLFYAESMLHRYTYLLFGGDGLVRFTGSLVSCKVMCCNIQVYYPKHSTLTIRTLALRQL